ncbi:MAG: phage capsid protein [Candidatus Kapaibacterium sp.]|nr:MAG: phage capsid protein [Candidatus Kapabacteria bacterium]
MKKQELQTKLDELIKQAREMVDTGADVDAIERVRQDITATKAKLGALEEAERAMKQATQSSTGNTLLDALQSDDARLVLQSRKGRFMIQNVSIPTPTWGYAGVWNTVQPTPSVVGTLVQSASRAQAITIYARETTTSGKGAAAPTAKGDTKPATTVTYASVQSVAQTIAHILKLSESDLADVAGLAQTVQQRGLQQLSAAVEDQVLNGNGTAPNLLGLLATTGVGTSTQGTDTVLDAIIKSIGMLASKGAAPTAIVCSYSTWALLQTAKDANGQYIMPANAQVGIANVRGVPLVASAYCPDNKVVLGNNRYATLWTVGGVAVEVDRADDDFVRNMVTMRIETRCALDVYRPEAFHVLTLA